MNKRQDICWLSGWAGYRTLFPVLGRLPHFHTPFFPMGEEELRQVVAKEVDTLIAWSTGAHMVLKWGEKVWRRCSTLLLIAPFLDFTRCMPPRILHAMQDRLLHEGVQVLGEFYANCGVAGEVPLPLDNAVVPGLVQGLGYLLTSQCSPGRAADASTRIHLVHGTADRIVPSRVFEEVCFMLPQAHVHSLPCGHYVGEHLLIPLIESIVH